MDRPGREASATDSELIAVERQPIGRRVRSGNGNDGESTHTEKSKWVDRMEQFSLIFMAAKHPLFKSFLVQ
jgi:hypothetical protein